MIIPPPRTEDEAKDLIARLDAYAAKSDNTPMFNIQNYQNEHLAYMVSSYGRFIGQFEMFFSCMSDYSHNINYLNRDWPINRGFQFMIITASLKQIHSGFNLLNKGAYEDSITVLRSAYESFLRILFVSIHPESPYNAYKTPGQTGTEFNATNLIKNELKLEWDKYSIMSVFAHSNMYQVMGDIIELTTAENQKPIRLDFKKDDDTIGLITNFINFLLTAYLTAYDELFTVDISKHEAKDKIQIQLNKLHDYALINQEALRTHNVSEYWRKTAVDLEQIFQLMKSMDENPNQDWKKLWIDIRSN